MLNRIGIKKKLVSAFMIIAIFTLLVGAFGLGAISSTNQNTKDIYSNHFVPTTYLFEIQKNLMQMNNYYVLMLYEKDILQTKNRLKEIERIRAENETLLEEYENSSKAVSELPLYQTLTEHLRNSSKIMDRLADLLSGNNYMEAMNLAPSFHSGINVLNKDIKALIDDNIFIAERSLSDSQNTYLFSFGSVIAVAVLCLVFAAAAGTYISKLISSPIVELSQAAERLALGDLDVAVHTQLQDEIGALVEAFNRMTDNMKAQAEAAESIALGNLEVEVTPRSQSDRLGLSIQSVIVTLKSLMEEVNAMTAAAGNGNFSYRGMAAAYSGGYFHIIQGINDTIEAFTGPMALSAEYMRKISRGEIPEEITGDYQGDFNDIKDSLNTCIRAVNSVITDVNMLSDAAIRGRLSVRADAGQHGGDFRKIVAGVNDTLDTIITPLYTAGQYLTKIGEGEIPELITDEYEGDFHEIKQSINSCIEGLRSLEAGRNVLERMSRNDFSSHMDEEAKGIYGEIAASINMVSHEINEITSYINHVAVGNLDDLEAMKRSGKKGDKDVLTPAIILMLETLHQLVNETTELSECAMQGQLSKRGQAQRYRGQYRRLMEGINGTLDAVIEPFHEVSAVMKKVAAGNLHVRMNGDYQGEFDEIKNAVNDTVSSLLRYIREISFVLSDLGNGNLAVTVSDDFQGDFTEIRNSLTDITENLNQMIAEISMSADQISSGSTQLSDESRNLARSSTEQAGSIGELTESINDISEQMKQSTANAGEASHLSESARQCAQDGTGKMSHMVEAIDKMRESSEGISKIIKVIDDIAFQTNILALNAAVEAARAGQHGRGFAVVADEVRTLAARSAAEAQRTSDLVEDTIRRIKQSTDIAQETASVFDGIVNSVERAAGLVSNIAVLSEKQTRGIMLIRKGIESVSQTVRNNTSSAEESAAASRQLSGQAELLTDLVGRFQLEERIMLSEGRDFKNVVPVLEQRGQEESDESERIEILDDQGEYELIC